MNANALVERPFVLVNMAMTADGKIATADRRLSSFGSRRDQEHLLALRATADAVMCGARTASLGGVDLGPGGPKYQRQRRRRGLREYNVRVIVTGSGMVDPQAPLFHRPLGPIILLTTQGVGAARLRKLRAVADEICVAGARRIDFSRALGWLRGQWGVKRLVCEGGGELNQALFEADLVDELHLTICPLIFGGRRAPTLADGTGWPHLAQARTLQLRSRRRVGDELFLVLSRGLATREPTSA